MGFPAILFGHLKNSSFLIFSSTWHTSSRNIALTAWVLVDPDFLVKFLLSRSLLYRSDLKSLLSWEITLALHFPYCWSSSTLLYLSIWFMSWRTLVTGFPVRDFLKPCSAGKLTLKVLRPTSSKSHLSHCTSPSICPSTFSGSHLLAWTRTITSPKAEVPYYTW